MQATKDNISLETAKLLKDCGIESKMYFLELYDENLKEKYVLNYGKHKKVKKQYPAFTWGEILWEHAEEFFGKKPDYGDGVCFNHCALYSHKILNSLQQKKYDEADNYFRDTCILIKNK